MGVALESICVKNDNTIRDACNNVIDMNYGGDHCDASLLQQVKMKYLLIKNHTHFSKEEQIRYETLRLNCLRAKLSITHPALDVNAYLPFDIELLLLQQSKQNFNEVTEKDIFDGVNVMIASFKHNALFLSTTLAYHLTWQRLRGFSKKSWNTFTFDICENYRKALVHSGEMVGPLTAESVSEPTIQLTLNTFHFCGISEQNVIDFAFFGEQLNKLCFIAVEIIFQKANFSLGCLFYKKTNK